MSNILLIDLDSTIPNLALMKLSTFHKNKNDNVYLNSTPPKTKVDKIYVSKIFKETKLPIFKNDIEIEIGGSGYNLSNKLEDKIEYLKPDYSLYPYNDYSIGYASRGCIRNCYFCIVQKKEGKLFHNEKMHPKNWYNPKFNKIKLFDNNFYADKEYFMEITKWIKEHDLYIDVTQGYDIRLIDNDIAKRIKELKSLTTIHFAFDDSKIKNDVIEGIKILKEEKIPLRSNIVFYCYCNDISQFENTLERINFLRENNIGAFCMFNKENPRDQNIKDLQRWSNRWQLYWSCTFKEYQKRLGHD